MRYKGVTRVITIFISRVVGHRYAIDVTPDSSEVVVGDKVVWNVQNAPNGVKVSVGNFRRFDPAPDILLRSEKAPLVRERMFNPAAPSGLIHQTKKADVGYYKYDVLFNGHTVLDPEIEIRGPRF